MSDPTREALAEVMSVNHSPFLGSDGIRPCLCVIHEKARAALSTTPAPLDVDLVAEVFASLYPEAVANNTIGFPRDDAVRFVSEYAALEGAPHE